MTTAPDPDEEARPQPPGDRAGPLDLPGPAIVLAALALAPMAAFLALIAAARAGAPIGGDPSAWLRLYAALALAAVGGIRLGNGLRTGAARGKRASLAVIGGALAPLAAFAALALPVEAGLMLLAFAWAALGAADSLAAARGRLPAWYGRLRIGLTLAAVAILAAALVAGAGQGSRFPLPGVS